MNVLERTVKRVLGVSGPDDTKFMRTRNVYRVAKARFRLIRHSYPRIVTLEPTTKCNSNCGYCPRSKLIRNGKIAVGNIEWRVLERIVDELRHCYDIEHIDLAGFGEPLLYPKLAEAIRFMRAILPSHTKVQVTTNGIILTEDIGKRLVDAGLDRMLISLNSFDQETYKQMNGVDKYHQVMLNTTRFLKLKGNKPPATKIQIMDTDTNRLLFNHFQSFWKPMLNQNDSLFIKRIDNMGGIIDSQTYDSTWHLKKRHPCYQLWQNLLISKDGDCYPCCIGEVAGPESRLWIGNVMNEGLDKILNGERLKAIRNLHKDNRAEEIPLCKACDMWRKSPNAWIEIRGKWR